jgi:hypothetical protein
MGGRAQRTRAEDAASRDADVDRHHFLVMCRSPSGANVPRYAASGPGADDASEEALWPTTATTT